MGCLGLGQGQATNVLTLRRTYVLVRRFLRDPLRLSCGNRVHICFYETDNTGMLKNQVN